MKRSFLHALVVLAIATAGSGLGQSRYLLDVAPERLGAVLSRHGLTLSGVLRDGAQGVYEVSLGNPSAAAAVETDLQNDPDVAHFEADSEIVSAEAKSAVPFKPNLSALGRGLFDRSSTTYFGAQVRTAYVSQPATSLIHLSPALSRFGSGNTIVADIDTGVDPDHPALRSVLVPGYDFTRDQPGSASELADVSQSTVAILDQSTVAILDGTKYPVILNQSTVAILDQSTVAILDATQLPAAFGHGTMTAGLIHLVAPTVRIMPLKAFRADGSAKLSDIVRAIYYAVDHGAKVINMSFSIKQPSAEINAAIQYAIGKNVICVASAGNDGREVKVYPAAFSGVVGVASTDANDVRSVFSNYGDDTARTAAPGEALITTYPGKNYAAVWGTSFSSALVAGTAALMTQIAPNVSPAKFRKALDHGHPIHQDCGRARLDVLPILMHCLLGQ